MKARMKAGHRPIVIGGGVTMVPEYPTWWEVPAAEQWSIDALVSAGIVEYEPARTANGTFAAPGLEVRRGICPGPGPGRPKKHPR